MDSERRIASAADERPPIAWQVLMPIAAAGLALRLAAAGGYGLFRDELYFIVCGWRLDWGYVDHPPITPLLARIGTDLFGTTAFGIRFPAIVISVAFTIVAALIARELGGGRFAQGMTAIAVLCAPHYLGSQGKLSTDAVEPIFWALGSLVLVRMIRRQDPRMWLWFGLLAGLGLQTKHSTVFFLGAMVFALMMTKARWLVWTRWSVLGGLVALAVFLPNLIWEYRHDWATFELLRNVTRTGKNVVLGPGMYFLSQLGQMHPIGSLLWLAGLAWFIFTRDGRRWRVFAWGYFILFVLFVALKGKAYYLASVYAVYFAAGAVWLESAALAARWKSGAARAFAVALVLTTIPMIPMVLPVLPVEELLAYQRTVGFKPPKTEVSHTAELAQYFADCFGWEAMTESVAQVYWALPEKERARAAVFVQNYGEAGAIDVFGRKRGLPSAMSGHQNYYLWGTHGWRGDVLIVMDDQPGSLSQLCNSLEDAGQVKSHPLAMPWEQNQRLYVCRGLKKPLSEVWPALKQWR
jgi:hypothetical protein